MEDRKGNGLAVLLAGLAPVCFCMRSPMSPVGPLVSQIQASLGLSTAAAGLLTAIPLLLFGLVALFAGRISDILPMRTLTPVCLGLSLLGILLRSYAGIAGLILGTGLIGLGIGILNVIIPVYIRTSCGQKIGVVMGVYTMSMTLFSALSAGFCVSASSALGGWENGLAVFGLLPALAVPLWLLLTPPTPKGTDRVRPIPLKTVASSGRHWCIALFMTLQSALFFSEIAWLPSALWERGAERAGTGYLMLMLQLVSLVTNFLMPVWMQRFPARRGALGVLCGGVYAAGFSVLLVAVTPVLRILCVVLLGLASGLSLSFALTLIAVQGSDKRETAGLSAFSQSVGYFLAAPAPLVLGAMHDAVGGFTLPFAVLLLLCIPMALCGVFAAKEKHGRLPKETAATGE